MRWKRQAARESAETRRREQKERALEAGRGREARAPETLRQQEAAPRVNEVRSQAPKQSRRAAAMVQEAGRAGMATRAAAAEQAPENDVAPWLRQLGFRADEVRWAAARCEAIPEASLEERLRLALSCLAPPHRRVAPSLRTAI